MATATMATAAGAAALMYYTVNRKLRTGADEMDEGGHELDASTSGISGIDRVSNRLIQAPATWLETISTLSETLGFTYSETLGKWPIGDLAFGINFLLKRQGNLHVENVFGGENSRQLKGQEVAAELKILLNLLTLCWHFSKKPFHLFLGETGYMKEEVLLQEPKAGILKPAFAILIDHRLKCFLLLIRGTHSIKDTLTAATGAVVPFHHSVVHAGGVNNLVLGYAHCGIVAAARWIAKSATPCLIKALDEYPDYKLKIVGHSLGGGTAALLTFILREQKALSSTSCVAFAPESGNDVITSVINGADLVPTFSAASVDDLRAEVTASAWLNDLKDQIEHTRIVSTVYRSASALGSRFPSMASARAKVAGAGAVLRPVSSGTQVGKCLLFSALDSLHEKYATARYPGVLFLGQRKYFCFHALYEIAVMRRAQTMAHTALKRPSLHLSWSCIGPRRRANIIDSKEREDSAMPLQPSNTSESLLSPPHRISTEIDAMELPASTSEGPERKPENGCQHDDATDVHGTLDINVVEDDGHINYDIDGECVTEVDLWRQLEEELYDQGDPSEATVEKEIREEEAANSKEIVTSPCEQKEAHRFFPPGKIMHIITLGESNIEGNGSIPSVDTNNDQSSEANVGIFLTPRTLYSKLRLSQRMISDHFMPVYRRQIDKVIHNLEREEETKVESGSDSVHGSYRHEDSLVV
ncbi:Diacylglycerol lipase-alpha-like protein [Drosera capensis]